MTEPTAAEILPEKARGFQKVFVTSEAIAPERDEAQFKGVFDYPSGTREFVLRVVKEKETGLWRVGFLLVNDEVPRAGPKQAAK